MLIAVDARRSVPDHTSDNYSTRSCELEIKKRADPHAGVFAGAASLYLRWFEIKTRHFSDVKVIETYPRVVWTRVVGERLRPDIGATCVRSPRCIGFGDEHSSPLFARLA